MVRPRGVSWYELEEKCPIDIHRLVVVAREIQNYFRIDQKNIERTKERMMLAKGRLGVLVRLLLDLLHDKSVLQEKTDNVIYFKLQDDFGRIIQELDESFMNNLVKVDADQIRINRIVYFINEMESILYGDIYHPLLNASEKEPENKRRFMYALYEMISLHVGVFGSAVRQKKKGSSLGGRNVMSYTDMLEEEGQSGLEREWDTLSRLID